MGRHSPYFYRKIGLSEELAIGEWASVLKVAHIWGFPDVRNLAVAELEPVASATELVVFGREFDIPTWRADGYLKLCERADALTLDEGRQLGLEDVMDIMNIRFHLRPCSHSKPDGSKHISLRLKLRRDELGDNKVADFMIEHLLNTVPKADDDGDGSDDSDDGNNWPADTSEATKWGIPGK